ncbi:unnamed protein product [Mesocestoides corti]|uniref:Tropomyosin n=2 Tax=Mesocestoides corti TaxID=53468 RepID=A0A158QTT5_MESCO|nr:unnamed protein product [Mesocestoides corti]
MDSIKKKMLAMKLEKENALDKAINLESQLKEKARDFEKKEEEMNEMLAKVKNIQAEVDTVQESLQEAISKLEETEKRATNLMKMEGSATVETVKSKILAMTSEKERLEREIALKNDDIEIERRKKEAAEAEVAAMTRRIRLLEEDFEQSSGRLTETSTKLDDASKAAEESESARWRLNNQQGADELKISELERAIATATMATEEAEWKYEECMKKADYCSTSLSKKTIYSNFNGRACRNRKTLETRSISDDERMAQLEDQVKEAKYIAEDAERKYDEAIQVMRFCSENPADGRINAARRLAITEVDLERAESRLETSESKIVELEEELRIVGNNMKSLEVSEQESLQREESYEETIRDLTERLKTNAELEAMYLKRLDLLREQLKEAEQRAAEAERQVSKLQNEVDRLEGSNIITTCYLELPANVCLFLLPLLASARFSYLHDASQRLSQGRRPQKPYRKGTNRKYNESKKPSPQRTKLLRYFDRKSTLHWTSTTPFEALRVHGKWQAHSKDRKTSMVANWDELLSEKERYRAISGELDTTFAELTSF